MHHMLSAFTLRQGVEFKHFADSYAAFVSAMRSAGMIEGCSPIGRRVKDTPMDTDEERRSEVFTIMSFRDRAQLDASYAYLLHQNEPGLSEHRAVFRMVVEPVFTCWADDG